MSTVARFHRLPAAQPDLLAGRSALDAFVASRPDDLGGLSGEAVLALDLILADDGLSVLAPGGASERLSAEGGDVVALFPHDAARALLAGLDTVALSPERVETYLLEEGVEADPASVAALRAALDALKACLRRVGPGEIGVLFVG